MPFHLDVPTCYYSDSHPYTVPEKDAGGSEIRIVKQVAARKITDRT